MSELSDKIMELSHRPDTKPFLFAVGQTARVRKGVSNDGQTPEYWDGAEVEIIAAHSSMLFKNHYYQVRHLDNYRTCEFEECELDRRYIRKKGVK